MENKPINSEDKRLSLEEWRALIRRCRGLNYEQIATELVKSDGTIKYQINSALEKMGYENKTWNVIGKQVNRRLIEEKEIWRPLDATEDPPPIPEQDPPSKSPPPSQTPGSTGFTVKAGPPSRRWVVRAVAFGAAVALAVGVLGFILGFMLGRGQAASIASDIGPTATARIERIRETVVVAKTVLVPEKITVEVTKVVPQTVEVTSTPSPQEPTATLEARAAGAVASAPTAASTPSIVSTPLALPFEDNFDLGLKPEWEVVSGDPLIENRHLTYRYPELPLVIRIGDAAVSDYTLVFDSVDMVANPAIQISMGEEWRVSLTHVGASRVRVVWERLTANGFQLVSTEDPPDARIVGRYQLQAAGDMFTLSYNGGIVSQVKQEGITNRGRVQISLNGGTASSAIDNFKLAAP